jgi:hypothetical protein
MEALMALHTEYLEDEDTSPYGLPEWRFSDAGHLREEMLAIIEAVASGWKAESKLGHCAVKFFETLVEVHLSLTDVGNMVGSPSENVSGKLSVA